MSAYDQKSDRNEVLNSKSPWLHRFLSAVLLIAAGVMFWYSLPSSAHESASVVASSDLETLNKTDEQDCLTKPIEEIRPGDWVLAGNPEVLASMPDTAVNRAGWRLVTLQAMGPGDDLFDIQLLRSQKWIAAAGAEVGGTIPLCIPEQGLDGPADVLDIAPCPPAKAKTDPEARLVTGTFTHHREIYELSVAALEEPIGTTDNHPFWSVDRQEFVPAGQLNIGERLQLASGEATTVTKANYRRGPPERVYNLEVDADHTYHVTDAGVLVHNNCPDINAQRAAEQLTQRLARFNKFVHPGGQAIQLGQTRVAVFDTITGKMYYDVSNAGSHLGVLQRHGLPTAIGRYAGGFLDATSDGRLLFNPTSGTFPQTSPDLPSNILDLIRGTGVSITGL